MKVSELIEKLKTFPPDAICVCQDGLDPSDLYPVDDVSERVITGDNYIYGTCPGDVAVIIGS